MKDRPDDAAAQAAGDAAAQAEAAAAASTPGAGEDRPIGDYALLGDCHSAALVSRDGSIDWCCMPRFDADSCFARLLDRDRGGHFRIAPRRPCHVRRTYRGASLVLETEFASIEGDAAVRITDFFAMRRHGRLHPRHELVRIVEGLRGAMPMQLQFSPRFEYGAIRPWIYRIGEHAHCAVGSDMGLVLFGELETELRGEHDLAAEFELRAGERVHLGLAYVSPAQLHLGQLEPPQPGELASRRDETLDWWQAWASRIRLPPMPGREHVLRSAVVLKALTYAPTGAIVAAPTTSLPESPGGERNWDYRYSWIRDSVLTVHSLAQLGCVGESDGFRRFIQRSAAGDGEQLKALVGIEGKRRLTEVRLDHLRGWRDSRPVRIGNAAELQYQGDKYGLLLELAARASERGLQPDRHYWDFLVEAVEVAARRWPQPDAGIWEVRGEPRHFVHSKVMCWAALQRGIELAERHRLPAPLAHWRRVRDEIRRAVEEHGVDRARGHFVGAFGARDLDAALLLLPEVGFVDWNDERMRRTTAAVRAALDDGHGLLLRYTVDDGLHGREGAFLACSFWLVQCLARQGERAAAHALFERLGRCANDLGLFAEEYDSANDEPLGNYPQGFTHLTHIAAALALDGGNGGR